MHGLPLAYLTPDLARGIAMDTEVSAMLPVRPDFPGEIALGVGSGLPVLDVDVVAGDGLDGFAQAFFTSRLDAPAGTVTSEACTVMMTPRPLRNNLERMTGGRPLSDGLAP